MNRRQTLATLLCGAAALVLPVWAASPRLPVVEVHKSPTCGCCGAWVEHMQAAGFEVRVHEVENTAVARQRYGMPERFGSCHTAVVAGYVVEGHVPASEVKRLLSLKPRAIGLAVPGMPLGSPGMEMGPRVDPYAVLLVDPAGRESVFARYPKA